MKKPEDKEPKDITEEDELSEEQTDQVSGGVLLKDASAISREAPTVLGGASCTNCAKGAGSTEDWKAVG
jgi:hypothetical protein